MTKTIDRRSVLTAAPALALAPTAASTTPFNDKTPILSLFHRHQAMVDRGDAEAVNGVWSEAKLDTWFREINHLQDRILALPTTCASDFAAKAIVDTARGHIYPDWAEGDIWKEARALTGYDADVAAPTPEAGKPDTPIERLFQEWQDELDKAEFANDKDLPPEQADALVDHLCARRHFVEDQIAALPAQTERDLLVKIYVGTPTHDFCFYDTVDDLSVEIRKWVGTTDRFAAQARHREAKKAAREALVG